MDTSIQVSALAKELGVSILELQDAQRLLGVPENKRASAWVQARHADILRQGFRDGTWGRRGSGAVGKPLDEKARRRRVQQARRDITAGRRSG